MRGQDTEQNGSPESAPPCGPMARPEHAVEAQLGSSSQATQVAPRARSKIMPVGHSQVKVDGVSMQRPSPQGSAVMMSGAST